MGQFAKNVPLGFASSMVLHTVFTWMYYSSCCFGNSGFFMTRSKYVIEKEDVQRQARGIMIVHCTLDELFLYLCHFKLCSFSYWFLFVLNSLEQKCFDCTPRSCMSKMAEIVTFQEGPSLCPQVRWLETIRINFHDTEI